MKTKNVPSKRTSTRKKKPAYRPGKNPEEDAWYKAFMIENHLDHYGYPEMVASPEQIRFIVFLEEDESYYPCSDQMFHAIMSRNKSTFLKEKYNEVLNKILALVETKIEDKKEKKFLHALIKIKCGHETRDQIMIPSRLEKRLLRIFLTHTQIEDPFQADKFIQNQRVSIALQSNALVTALNHFESSDPISAQTTLSGVREKIDYLELKRLLTLCVESDLCLNDVSAPLAPKDYQKLFKRPLKGNGVDPFFHFLGIPTHNQSETSLKNRRILWLADEAGEVIIDIAIIRHLVKMGHKIIIAFKDGALFTKVDFKDARESEILKKELEDAFFITEKELSKNELVKIMRSDYDIFVISDGTRENLNLLLTTTTFARIFKEVDGIISRGHDQRRRFFDTRFQFTQDIYNISKGNGGAVLIAHKPRHPGAIKFSHKDLENKAETIIKQMETAKNNGMTVIFYSAIIGSIPGKIPIAKQIIAVFIDLLKTKLDMTYIINPSEYYEPGMDADDLMYMWEIVQRSGLIDIWRFQTYEDISQAFHIIGAKVPPEWVGKDATYSTGCTKEMKIALEVQQQFPEMQIIGPSKERFMRRNEYAIGKMFDIRLSDTKRL